MYVCVCVGGVCMCVCLIVCDPETSTMRRPAAQVGLFSNTAKIIV
jgi:hypothetical protein